MIVLEKYVFSFYIFLKAAGFKLQVTSCVGVSFGYDCDCNYHRLLIEGNKTLYRSALNSGLCDCGFKNAFLRTLIILAVKKFYSNMTDVKQGNGFIIWILGALATITPIAIDLYLPAFSQIAEDFNTTPATISLSVSSYFIGMALGQMLYGPLLDRYGRKRPLYAGLLIFILASLGCMQSWNVEALVGFRFLQALGGSAAWVAAVAMVRDFFPIEQSARVFSLLILILGVSPLLAPTIGGYITTALGWQSIFMVLAAVALLTMVVVFLYLPEGHQPDPTVSLKAKSMVLTFVDILRQPQFYTYTFAGAFAFATLFIYVAGSPVIFMEIFK